VAWPQALAAGRPRTAKAAASKQTNATVMGRRFILCKPNLEPAPLFKMIAPNSTLTGENERTKKFCFFR
jgi:hypothetical protein